MAPDSGPPADPIALSSHEPPAAPIGSVPGRSWPRRYGDGRRHAAHPNGRNPGDVWSMPTRPYRGPRFAACAAVVSSMAATVPAGWVQTGANPGGGGHGTRKAARRHGIRRPEQRRGQRRQPHGSEQRRIMAHWRAHHRADDGRPGWHAGRRGRRGGLGEDRRCEPADSPLQGCPRRRQEARTAAHLPPRPACHPSRRQPTARQLRQLVGVRGASAPKNQCVLASEFAVRGRS